MTTTQPVRVCPGCGVPDDQWKANNGLGYIADNGRTYCCQDCAAGRDCSCAL